MKNNKPDLVHVFDQATQIIHLSLKPERELVLKRSQKNSE